MTSALGADLQDFGSCGFWSWSHLVKYGEEKRPDDIGEPDPADLAGLFRGFTQYFQEILWLLTQKSFGALCRHRGLTAEHLQHHLDIQKRAFLSGRQVHLGEILMQTYLLTPAEIYDLLKKLGMRVLFCPSCRKYFVLPMVNPLQTYNCLHCEGALTEADPDSHTLLQSMRTNFLWPRPISRKLRERHDSFLFFNPQEHCPPDFKWLDREMQEVLYAFNHWLLGDTAPKKYPPARPKDARGDPLAITSRIAHCVASVIPTSHAGESALQGPSQDGPSRDDLQAFSSLFFGYYQNLQELFWLLSQKVFEQICGRYVSREQFTQALKIHKKAFLENRQVHLAEVILQTYLLPERQIQKALDQTGLRVLVCRRCHREYLQMAFSSREHSCQDCQSVLEVTEAGYDTLLEAMRMNFAHPVAIAPVTLVPHGNFEFFAARDEYTPDFSLSEREIVDATRCYRFEKGMEKESGHREVTATLAAVPVADEEFSDVLESKFPPISGAPDELKQSSMPAEPATDEEPTGIPAVRPKDSILGKIKKTTAAFFMPKKSKKEAAPAGKTSAKAKDSLELFLEDVSKIQNDTAEEDIYDDEGPLDFSYSKLRTGQTSEKRSIAELSDEEILKALEDEPVSEDSRILLKKADIEEPAAPPRRSDREPHPESRRLADLDEKIILKALEDVSPAKPQRPPDKFQLSGPSRRLRTVVPTQLEYIGEPQSVPRRSHFFLIFLILISSIAVLGLLLHPYFTAPAKKDRRDKKTPVETQVEPVKKDTSSESTKPANGNKPHQDSPTEQTPEIWSPSHADVDLAEVLRQTDLNPSKLTETLYKLADSGSLTEKNLPVLKEIYYDRYPMSDRVRLAAINAMGKIAGGEACSCLRAILLQSPHDKDYENDRMAAIKALKNLRRPDSKEALLHAFQQKPEGVVGIALARALTEIAPSDETVYQMLEGAFSTSEKYQPESYRVELIQAMSSMKIPRQNGFFMLVICDPRWEESVRLQAINALRKDAPGNACDYISQLSEIEMNLEGTLREEVERTIQFLLQRQNNK